MYTDYIQPNSEWTVMSMIGSEWTIFPMLDGSHVAHCPEGENVLDFPKCWTVNEIRDWFAENWV